MAAERGMAIASWFGSSLLSNQQRHKHWGGRGLPEAPVGRLGIRGADAPGGRFARPGGLFFHRCPLAPFTAFSRAARLAVDQALAEQFWDVVVFDSINSAWALPTVLRRRLGSGRPPLVYLAHNCEATAARRIAAASRGLEAAGEIARLGENRHPRAPAACRGPARYPGSA
jgi:hypothetical protein